MKRTLLVFLKSPRPGGVKTRLAAAIGDAAAAELYRALAEQEVRGTTPRTGEYERLFFHEPPEVRPEMEAWFPGETWIAQSGTDLGRRMSSAFSLAFDRGADQVAVIGSDVPTVTRLTVLEAFEALRDHDAALGPAEDGGYYLLALPRPIPELFEDIAWSTPAVRAATLDRAGALGLRTRLLAPLRDIDTIDDVRAEWPRLQTLLAGREALARVLHRALER